MNANITRRSLLNSAGALAVAPTSRIPVPGDSRRPRLDTRPDSAYDLRVHAALRQSHVVPSRHMPNGDEALLPGRIASYTKALPHAPNGEVSEGAFRAMLEALSSGNPSDFEQIPLGYGKRLTNPQAAFAYALEGGDSHRFGIPPAPSFSSEEAAWEMTELYWQSLARDVPFADYAASPVISEAANELGTAPAAVFRGETPGDLHGPYISQFLLQPVPYLSGKIEQRYRTPRPGTSFMTSFDEWLRIQQGDAPARAAQYLTELRYLTCGRDLAEYVHYDVLYQPYLNAAMILLNRGPETEGADGSSVLHPANPYRSSPTEDGFVTFGAAHIADWLGRVSTAALKAAWCQKWLVHRRLRPEAFGGRVHLKLAGEESYPIPQDLLQSTALARSFMEHGSYLLPQAYPEGSPTHPSYPAGHATVAGACSVILKSFFDEDALLTNCVESTADGLALQPYRAGFASSIGAEVNKLAFNISMGRDWAGIHYRSDAREGMRLGEEVAISVLEDLADTFTEKFSGLSFTRLDGTRVKIK